MGQKASQRIEQYSRIEVYVFKVSWQLVIFSFGEVSIYHTHKYIHTVYFADMSIKHTLCVCMYICVCGICMYMASVYSLTHMCVHVHPYTHTHTWRQRRINKHLEIQLNLKQDKCECRRQTTLFRIHRGKQAQACSHRDSGCGATGKCNLRPLTLWNSHFHF